MIYKVTDKKSSEYQAIELAKTLMFLGKPLNIYKPVGAGPSIAKRPAKELGTISVF